MEEKTFKNVFQFWVVNGVTLSSLLFGVLSIGATMTGNLTTAALCLVASVLLDGIDGSLARKWSVTSPFGVQLDSLADMTAFGVATALFSYMWLIGKQPDLLILVGTVAGLVALTSAIRLARFNVGEKSSFYFQGIPTTAAGGMIVLTYVVMPDLPFWWGLLLVGGVALLMVSNFPYMKLRQFKKLPIWLLLPLLLPLWLNWSLTIIGLEFVYILSGPALWLFQHFNSDITSNERSA